MSNTITWTREEFILRSFVDPVTTCWIFNPDRLRADGYRTITHLGRSEMAHRLAYRVLVGEIEPDMEIDHTCHARDLTCKGGDTCPHRACVNPDHLEMVTRSENVRRSGWRRLDECRHGHKLEGWNLVIYKGGRTCRTCIYSRNRGRPRPKAIPCLECGKRTTKPGQICRACLESGEVAC